MAPGSAEVFSPCGIAGGNTFRIEGCDYKNGDFCTWWWGGATVLDRMPEICTGRMPVPEESQRNVFRRYHSSLPSENSWAQYGYDDDSKIVFKDNRTVEGTYPPGSDNDSNSSL